MNQRKPNKKAWYSLGLAGVLCAALLVTATGTTMARYRAEREEKIYYTVRVPDQIYLGTVTERVAAETDVAQTEENTQNLSEQIFQTSEQLQWEIEKDVACLHFAVANGVSETDYAARDQKVRVRMIGTLGIWMGTQTPELILTIPAMSDDEKEIVAQATVAAIEEGTPLYYSFGEGWVYTFLDDDGRELVLELAGGQLSYVNMTVSIDGEIPNTANLLQPQVIAEVVQE